jgi:hypothetical protein
VIQNDVISGSHEYRYQTFKDMSMLTTGSASQSLKPYHPTVIGKIAWLVAPLFWGIAASLDAGAMNSQHGVSFRCNIFPPAGLIV